MISPAVGAPGRLGIPDGATAAETGLDAPLACIARAPGSQPLRRRPTAPADGAVDELRGIERAAAVDAETGSATRRVLDAAGWRCSKCGQPGKLECHHVVAVEDGGSSEFGNLAALCVGCHVDHHRVERIGPQRAAWREWLVNQGCQ